MMMSVWRLTANLDIGINGVEQGKDWMGTEIRRSTDDPRVGMFTCHEKVMYIW